MNKLLKTLGFAIIILFAATLLFSKKAEAAGEPSNTLPADGTSIVISNAGAWAGSFSSPESWNYWYIPSGSTNASVSIDNISNSFSGANLSGGRVNWFGVWALVGGNCQLIANIDNANPGDAITINPSLYGTDTITDANTTYRQFCVSGGTSSINLVYYQHNSSAGTLLGIYDGNNRGTGTGLFANSGSIWDETISFATNCNIDGDASNNHVLLYDLDNGYSQTTVFMYLMRFDRASGALIQSDILLNEAPKNLGTPDSDVTFSSSGFGINNYATDGGDYAPYNNNYTWDAWPQDNVWHSDSRYELHVTGIGRNNKIRVRLPFAQFNSALVCGIPTCVISNIRTAAGSATIHPNDQIIFDVTTTHASGLVLGVNGPAYSEGAFGNYLVTGAQFVRTPIPPDGVNFTVSLYSTADDTNYVNPFKAPGLGGNYAFNWGLKSASAWVNSCTGSFKVNQTPSGELTANCDVGGTLTVSMSARDPDGGNISYSVTIPTVGVVNSPPGGVASPNTNALGGPYPNRPKDGITKTVTGTVTDAQTSEVVAMTPAPFACPRPLATLLCVGEPFTEDEAGVPGTLKVSITKDDILYSDPSTASISNVSFSSIPAATNLPANINPALSINNGQTKSATLSGIIFPNIGNYTIKYVVTWNGIGANTPISCESFVTVKSKPYLKVYGGDVSAGGAFPIADGSCPNTAGGIYAFAKKGPGSSYQGASGQLTVSALLNINGFYSSSNRIAAGTNMPPKGTTIANTGGDEYGGNAEGPGGSKGCITDYYKDTVDTSLPAKGNAEFPPPDTVIPAVPAIPGIPATPGSPAMPGPPIPQPSIPVNMFYWTDAGPNSATPPTVAGYPFCIRFDATATDTSWGDNWLCSRIDLHLAWYINSPYNPIVPNPPYKYWQVIYEPSANFSVTHWDGRYILTSTVEPGPYRYLWIWNSAANPTIAYGQPGARTCTHVGESSAPASYTWADDWLCSPWYLQPQPSIPGPIIPAVPGTPAVPGVPAVPAQTIPGAFPAGKSRYMLTGAKTIGPLGILKQSQVVVYVDNDVYITDDIIYDGSPRASRQEIPYFALIVKGNIRIAPGVKRLDGLYIAQPNPATAVGGKIYTCAPNPAGNYTLNDVYDNCKGNQLTINGALIARQVKFLRTINSLKDSTPNIAPASGEAPDFSNGQGGNVKAAETINFNPELYLAPSPLKEPGELNAATTANKYDSITALPPVF